MRSRSSKKRIWRRKERFAASTGATSGAPARERGSVLLMVIGVLALLAIIAVVYASLGQSDRRTSSAFVRSVQIEDVSGQVSDYLADIIGRDVLQVATERFQGGGGEATRQIRLFSTYPGIAMDDDVRSGPPASTLYSPVVPGSQPWLAPIEPTFIRHAGTATWVDRDRQYLDYRDWMTISNVAPNGRFVNLANLRNNFYAEPGIATDALGKSQMSRFLTMFGPGPNGRPQGAGLVQRVDGQAANLNIPWHWTAMQQNAARPVTQFATDPNAPGPAENEYYTNQWADADGDGIGDSRWFEFVSSGGPGGEFLTQGLAQQDQTRYFAAVRIVDLSGMVSVNTAMDLLTPPGPPAPDTTAPLYPFGRTGADVDLLRVLTNKDAYERYGVGYDAFQQGGTPASAINYTQYVNDQANPASLNVGRSAYAALQWAIATDRRPSLQPGNIEPNGQVPTYDLALSEGLLEPFATTSADRLRLFVDTQRDATAAAASSLEYTDVGGVPRQGLRTRLPFGASELLELHAFFGLNDPRERSRLEAVLDGRRNTGPDARPNFGPLRSGRPLAVERERRGDQRANGVQDDDSLAQQHLDIRKRLTTIAAARPLTSLAWSRAVNASQITDEDVKVDLTPYLYPPVGETDEQRTAKLRRLYNYACDALMPYRTIDSGRNFWNRAIRSNAAIHYGGSADMASRSAAHWMVNIIDSVDDDNSTDPNISGPTCITLRSVGSAPTTPDQLNYPWPHVNLTADSLEVAPNGRFVQSQRVNIYGIEAQPFLAEASSYAFYYDVPFDAVVLPGQTPPDNEFDQGDPDGPGGPIPWSPVPITIDNDVSYENADFLGEIVAFQITNPFDRQLVLTRVGSAGPEFLYYVEYANRFFPLAKMDQSSEAFLNEEVSLNPGETRVFFATSPRREFNFNERFLAASSSTARPGGVPVNFLQEWVSRQFKLSTEGAGTRDPIQTTIFNPETFAIIPPDGGSGGGDPERALVDIQGERADSPPTVQQRKFVNLWRILRTNTEPTTSNVRGNDLLADRLRDPAGGPEASMFQRLDSGPNDEVPDTEGGDDSSINPLDNTGFSVTMWGTIRRPTNPVRPNSSDQSPLGAMPPWCIETRRDQWYRWNAAGVQNQSGNRFNLNRSELGPSGRRTRGAYGGSDTAYTELDDLVTDQAQGDGGTRINDEIRQRPESKNSNPIPYSASIDEDTGNPKTFAQQAIRIALAGRASNGAQRNQGLYKRIGDIYQPLAIGPWYDPNIAAPDPNNPEESRRFTLSEALALAADYYSPQPNTLYFRAGSRAPAQGGNPAVRPKLDRGHLVIDDFVPFFDQNDNGVLDVAGGRENTLGLGIPMALNMLDKFRLDNYGGRSAGEVGKVNINSAGLLTLSALPMLAPDPLSPWITTDDGTTRRHFYDPLTQQADRAATLVSYRDKIDVITRPLLQVSGPVAVPAGARDTQEITFRDTVNLLTSPWLHDGRRTRTNIPGLRETRGFRSIGEIMAARLQVLPTTVPANQADQYRSNSMDWHGRDRETFTGQRGIEPVNVRNSAGIEVSDEVVDDYSEKLAIADAVLGSVTTRSDMFCVWFVIHGYVPADVEGLGPDDPMIPTIARRYMMVVDRTNVVKDGDKPRIVLFREVPM